MDPSTFSVEYKGKWTTIRTCAGAVGAFRIVSGEQPNEWESVSVGKHWRSMMFINGCCVMEFI